MGAMAYDADFVTNCLAKFSDQNKKRETQSEKAWMNTENDPPSDLQQVEQLPILY